MLTSIFSNNHCFFYEAIYHSSQFTTSCCWLLGTITKPWICCLTNLRLLTSDGALGPKEAILSFYHHTNNIYLQSTDYISCCFIGKKLQLSGRNALHFLIINQCFIFIQQYKAKFFLKNHTHSYPLPQRKPLFYCLLRPFSVHF